MAAGLRFDADWRSYFPIVGASNVSPAFQETTCESIVRSDAVSRRPLWVKSGHKKPKII